MQSIAVKETDGASPPPSGGVTCILERTTGSRVSVLARSLEATGQLRGCFACPLAERQQVGVDLILQRRRHAVRSALVDFQRGSLNDLGGEKGRGHDGHNLIFRAV